MLKRAGVARARMNGRDERVETLVASGVTSLNLSREALLFSRRLVIGRRDRFSVPGPAFPDHPLIVTNARSRPSVVASLKVRTYKPVAGQGSVDEGSAT